MHIYNREKEKIMKRKIKVASVCGSGTVSSSMVSQKIMNILKENGYQAEALEVNPSGMDMIAGSGDIDMICHTCPLKKDYGIPKINATGFLTGIGEENIAKQILEIAEKLQ